jgi:NAD(P)H-hydrate epimerase
MARPLVTSAEMRALDTYTIERIGVPGVCLMEVAGRAVAAAVEGALAGRQGGRGVWARAERPRVAVVCGGGNNGGDGFVCARALIARGLPLAVVVYLTAAREKVSGDARTNLESYERIGGAIVDISTGDALESALEELAQADVLVDALLGTGLSQPVRGHLAEVLGRIGAVARGARVAVDVPSGLSADTGQPMGPVIRADVTITFGHLKRGLAQFPGVRLAGRVEVADIGIPRRGLMTEEGVSVAARTFLTEELDVREAWPRRSRDAHKGTFGHLLVMGGSRGLTGAPLLAAHGALRSGAGKVSLAVPGEVLPQVEAQKPLEAMCRAFDGRTLAELTSDIQAVTLGPGLGRAPERATLVLAAVDELQVPLVLDADALFLLGGRPVRLQKRPAATVLTPHPGEMAQLMGVPISQVQSDRIEVARRFAAEHKVVVVLKGAGTVVAGPDGDAHVVPFGNPGMATGGTGDVLAGIIGALLAGHMPAMNAALLGACVHALSGDVARRELGEAGMAAADLYRCLPRVLQALETGAPLPV